MLSAVLGHGVNDVTVLQTQSQSENTGSVAVVPLVALVLLDVDGTLLAATLGDDLRATGGVGRVLGGDAHRVHVLIMTHAGGRDNNHLIY